MSNASVRKMRCGHETDKPHYARGMCNTCYERWRNTRKRERRGLIVKSKPTRAYPLSEIVRGDRYEIWEWTGFEYDVRVRQVWIVEFSGTKMTGGYGPLSPYSEMQVRDWKRRIIRMECVTGTLEGRRDEFKVVGRVAA